MLLIYKIFYRTFSVFFRVFARFYRRIFSRQSKSIITHWIKNIHTLHSLEARINIPYSIIQSMAHMQSSRRWIRKHFKNIKLLFLFVYRTFKNLFLFPFLLPFCLYFLKIINHIKARKS